jgi:type IV secretory pathway TraG/TraD family ATPase VirD4
MANLIVLLFFLATAVFLALSLILGKARAALTMFRAVGGTFSLLGKLLTFCFNGARGLHVRMPIPAGASMPILAPGDNSPPADRYQDYSDYRGVAAERELTGLCGGAVSLGRYQHPRGKLGSNLSLPISLLHRNCAVIGPPGSGKTEGIIIPWILQLLQNGHSVVTVDVKGDLIDRLRGEVTRLGVRSWYWNFGDGARSQRWNWLDGPVTDQYLEAAVQSILGKPKPNDPQPFFYERDCRWLRALIPIVKHVYAQQPRPRYLYHLISDQNALQDVFRRYPTIRSHAPEVADLLQLQPDEHSRAVSGLLNALHLFNSAGVIKVTEKSDFQLSDLTSTPTLLVVGASLADGRAGEVLSSILLSQLFAHVYTRFSVQAASNPRSLFCIIDEAARLKDRIRYEEVLSISRSAGVGFCLASQDISQFGDEQQVAAILSNCLTFLTLKGCSPQTARYLSGRLGQRASQVVMVNHNRGPFQLFSQQGRQVQSANVPVLAEREIMHPPGNYCAVVQVSPVSSKPFLVDLTRTVP